jgi:alkyldihydroxyacetonephosphate synthase
MVSSSPAEGSVPWRWGDPQVRYPERGRNRVLAYLARRLGGGPAARPGPGPRRTHAPPSRLSAHDLQVLRGLVDQGQVQDDDRSRLLASVGASYLDVIHLIEGEASECADAVVEPASVAGVEALMQWADREGIALIPRSGGTSVVGGLDPLLNGHRAAIVVSVRRLCRPGVVRPDQQLASFEAGILGPELETHLRRYGLTLGHFPQSFERSALGGWIAARSYGQASTRYQTPADRLEGFIIVTPRGTIRWARSHGPPAEPDPGSIVPGSEGTLGVLTEATLRVERLPETTRWFAALLPTWERGIEAIRRLIAERPVPAVVRVSDGEETDLTLAESGWEAGGRYDLPRRLAAAGLGLRGSGPRQACLLIVSFEGTSRETALGGQFLRSLRRELGAAWLPAAVGRTWERSRFHVPYLRDDLIERGWFVETFETFVPWASTRSVKFAAEEAVRTWANRRSVPAYVGAHLSHPASEGASLYFSVIALQKPGEEEAAWLEFKQATAEAVVVAGGTVSHHHGIGRYHRPWAGRSIAAWRIEGLRTLKARWDPNGIMNPGKTLPKG